MLTFPFFLEWVQYPFMFALPCRWYFLSRLRSLEMGLDPQLFLFQCDDPIKLKDTDTYTSLPASPAELNPAYGTTQGNVFFRKSEKEMITIETLLCSTKITQNSKYSKGFAIEYLWDRSRIFQLIFRWCLNHQESTTDVNVLQMF